MRVRKLLLASAVASAMATPAAFAAPPSSTLGFGYTPPPGSDPMSTADSKYCSDAAYTCSTQPITDTGFLQVQITEIATGKTYFQTIIDDPTSSFQTVSFVTTGSTNGGVAAQQSLNEGGLSDTTTIYTGSFRDTAKATESDVAIDQSVSSTAAGQFTADFGFTKNQGNSGNNVISLDQVVLEEFTDGHTGTHSYTGGGTVYEFADRFALTQTQDGAGNILGGTIDIDSGVRLNDVAAHTGTTVSSGGVAVDASNTPTSADALFVFNKRSGSEIAAANVGNATLGGTTVDWVVGDTISQTLIEQTVTDAGDFAFASVSDLVDTGAAGDNDAVETGSNFSLSTSDATSLFTINVSGGAAADPFL